MFFEALESGESFVTGFFSFIHKDAALRDGTLLEYIHRYMAYGDGVALCGGSRDAFHAGIAAIIVEWYENPSCLNSDITLEDGSVESVKRHVSSVFDPGTCFDPVFEMRFFEQAMFNWQIGR